MKKLPIEIPKLLSLLGIVFLVILFWNTVFIFPLKLLVVLLHEISHGLAAVLTGGKIVSIEVNMNQGGLATTIGGNRFFIISAGYLGSMIWGGTIMVLASRFSFDRQVAMVLGVGLALVGLIYVANFSGKAFTIAFSTLLILMASFAPNVVNDFVLKVIGMSSVLYAIIDIKSDAISRNIAGSDASKLGELYFGNSAFWGIIWIGIATLSGLFFLYIAAQKEIR